MKKLICRSLFLSLLCVSHIVSALSIDSLFLVSDQVGKDSFSIANNSNDRVYLKTEMLQVKVENNGIKKVKLDKDNLLLWDVALEPSVAILNPGESRIFSAKSLCQNNCDRDEDKVYQFRFIPSDDPREIKAKKSISFQFGVAPFYIMPASKQHVEYNYKFDKKTKKLHVSNTGNTFIKFEVNNCSNYRNNGKKSCKTVHYVLSGISQDFLLPDRLISSTTKVKFANYDQSIEKQVSLF
ncbi:TPA: hypothetical protein ACX6PR_003758 [Photobacterium damselae]